MVSFIFLSFIDKTGNPFEFKKLSTEHVRTNVQRTGRLSP